MKRYDQGIVREPAGFTLVELLTVIVVIAILIGLLMPAISNIRERARCAKCVANLKQLHEAAMNYATDNSRLPAGASWESVGSSGTWGKNVTGWLDWLSYVPSTGAGDPRTYFYGANGRTCITNGTLYPYLQDMRVYLCPTFSSKFVLCGIADPVRSYGMCDQASEVYVSTIRNASRLLLFSEQSNRRYPQSEYGKNLGVDVGSDYSWAWQLWDIGDYQYSVPPTRAYNPPWAEGRRRYIPMDGVIDGFIIPQWDGGRYVEHIGAYHDGRANCIFVDGHTEKVSYTNTLSICSGTWGAVE